MGVFYDYYRAANRQAAVEKPEDPRAVEKPMRGMPAFDAVDAKGIDPDVTLGQLIALVRGIPYSPDLVRTVTVHPPPEEWEALPEDSLHEEEGAVIEELPADVRDTLAGIPDDRRGEFAELWAQIDDDPDIPSDAGRLLGVVTELRGLAQRAQKEDQLIYCWMAV